MNGFLNLTPIFGGNFNLSELNSLQKKRLDYLYYRILLKKQNWRITFPHIENKNMHITPAYKNVILLFLFWENFDK